jgi:hypothetical protein
MADIQKYIEQFDDGIRLKRFDENKTLREKRDAVLNKLRDRFRAWRDEDKDVPSFESFNQGSYAMGTGIQPAKGDYDIDVGLKFNCATSDYKNPVDLKVLVADALEGHTEIGTVIRRSCVTVFYKIDGEQAYHVDLAVYAYDDPKSASRRLYLAKGKRNSDESNRLWERSDPYGLIRSVENRFADDDDEAQFLRSTRILKRWKTERFSHEGNGAPSGIGLTIAGCWWFTPQITRDTFANTRSFDDLRALRHFADRLVSCFTVVGLRADGSSLYRLVATLPVEPYNDIFAKMSDEQMTNFRDRLISLRARADEAIEEPDPHESCKIMSRELGDEFPVPEKAATGQVRGRAISTAGVSA